MSELRELYQEVIFEHNRHPRNYGVLATANHQARGFNRLCGDKLNVFVEVSDGVIQNLQFEGSGCAICMASASLMTEAMKGKSLQQAGTIFNDFHGMVAQGQEPTPALGKLAVLSGVNEFPARVKCASLAWHTLMAALQEQTDQSVSTE